jgi:hypothetical protein
MRKNLEIDRKREEKLNRDLSRVKNICEKEGM